jgi:two-component system chemotaxis response regulator CheB
MRRNLIVVGASAGGVEALRSLVAGLPPDLPAAVLVVLHVPSYGGSVLPAILERAGDLPADHPEGEQPLEEGRIYVAPPDHHLLVVDGHCVVTRGPRENGHRPAIDPLFRSASLAFDGKVAGVVLSGTLDDGTAGLSWIKLRDGATLVQAPSDALYPAMPQNAIDFVDPDYVEPVEELVNTLVRLTSDAGGRNGKEAILEPAPDPSSEQPQPGDIAPFSCPSCGGSLWETVTDGIANYRCRVGHAYTLNSLVAAHGDTVERAMWTAYRALEEQAAMSRRVGRRLAERGRVESAERFERQAEQSANQAAALKRVLDSLEPALDVAAAAQAQPAG